MIFFRAIASIILFLLLTFFLIGVEASNGWESDPSSPISTSALAKAFLIPICIVLGLLLFKVAGPLFGGTRFAARSDRYQQQAQQKISQNRYSMGNDLYLTYGAAVLSLVLVLSGISNQKSGTVLVGIAIGVFALWKRGRLQSERAAAKALGARTLSDDVADGVSLAGTLVAGTVEFAVSSAIKGGKLLAQKIDTALSEPPEKIDISQAKVSQLKGATSMNESTDINEWFVGFIKIIGSNYRTQLQVIQSPETKRHYPAIPKPVSTGRQSLLNGFNVASSSKPEAKRLLNDSISQLDRGAVTPDASEWPIDGPEIGRGHACMWGAISRTLSHQQASELFDTDATKADAWFGMAVLIFVETGELVMAGRSLQEWGESRRLARDFESADLLFLAATCVFSGANQPSRANLAAARIGQKPSCPVDSSFFIGRPPTEDESQKLSSVLGARNTESFYRSLI